MKKGRDSKTAIPKEVVTAEILQMQQRSLKKLSSLMAIVCALLGLLLYVNTLNHNYTIDDDTVVQKNSIVKKGVSTLPEIFTTPYRKGFWDRQEAMYRPLSLAMFAIEWQISPGKPFIGHLVNVLIYALTGLILFQTLRKILSSYSVIVPFLATLLFIAHPLHTEVVASIKSRDELLSFLFLIVSLNFLFKYVKSEWNSIITLTTSAFCFLLALLSKESAITFLAIFPLTLFFFSDFNIKKIASITAVFILPLVIYFGMRAFALADVTSNLEIQTINNSLVNANGFGERLATAITVLGRYLMLLVLPHPLVFDYSYNQIPNVGFGTSTAIVSLLVLISLVVYSIFKIKKREILSFCILFFFITISIVSNILFLIESIMAERFLFLPSLGFCIALPIVLMKLFKKDYFKMKIVDVKSLFTQSGPVLILVIICLIFYSGKTLSRNAEWESNLTILKHDVKNSPGSARIRYALGAELLLNGAMKETDQFRKSQLLDESISQLEKGVEILPTYADAFYDLGLAYTEKGDGPNAVRSFEAAKRSKSWKEPEFFVSSGLAFGLAKQYDSAFAEFQKAISMSDTLSGAYNNWGMYLNESGRPKEGMQMLIKATELNPKYVAAWYNLGNSFAMSGDYEQAILTYEKVLAMNANYIDAMTNIGNCYAAKKDFPNSIVWYQKVLAIDPSNPKASQNLEMSKRISGQ